jgi:hypothetical protein
MLKRTLLMEHRINQATTNNTTTGDIASAARSFVPRKEPSVCRSLHASLLAAAAFLSNKQARWVSRSHTVSLSFRLAFRTTLDLNIVSNQSFYFQPAFFHDGY